MSAKSANTPSQWVDPDDAPELTGEFFEKAVWQIGEKVVSREEAQKELARMGRPPSGSPKKATNIRFSPDILAAFKSTGKGWQTRIDNALRDWLKTHSPA